MKKRELTEIITLLVFLIGLSFELTSVGSAIAQSHECDSPSTDGEIQHCVMTCQIPCEEDDILDLDCKAIESKCGFKLIRGVK